MYWRLAILALGAAHSTLFGALILTQPSGTTTTFPGLGGSNCTGAGTATVAGFSMSGDGGWCADYVGNFGLGDNGEWNDFALVGDNSGSTTITIDLGGLYGAAGGFMNYGVAGSDATVLSVLATDGTTVLESYNLSTAAPISTPAGINNGAFRGIQRGTADIRYLQLSGGFMVLHDLTLGAPTPSEIPEPATIWLAALAAGVFAATRRRFRAS